MLRSITCTILVLALMAGCATYETYYDVRPEELDRTTLWPGLELELVYADGTQAEFTVDEVTESKIVSREGREWSKTGIKELTIKVPPNSSDCGSLSSWRNGQCWKDEIDRKVDVIVCNRNLHGTRLSTKFDPNRCIAFGHWSHMPR